MQFNPTTHAAGLAPFFVVPPIELAAREAGRINGIVIKNKEPIGKQENGFFYLPLVSFLMLWH
jgi:hypothetical protein